MRVSVFGLGYVGTVTAACLARRGHEVVGVDPQAAKVTAFASGRSPIVEPGVAELLAAAREAGGLEATHDAAAAVRTSAVSIVSVGTPSALNGALDLSYVRQVAAEIAGALPDPGGAPHVLILRSTVLPGTTRRLVGELLAGPVNAGRLEVLFYPEFLREGSAVADFEDPPLELLGTVDGRPPVSPLPSALLGDRAAIVRWETAEAVKYASNAWHATKVAFANEIGRVAKADGIDGREVMEILCRDSRLALGPAYLQPGNPFGGSCLPKDLRALTRSSRERGMDLPLLESVLPSNEEHGRSLLAYALQTGQRRVVLLGLAFKPSTDDLRGSAMVDVAQTLLGRGFDLRIYDPVLDLETLVGSNKRLIDEKMPHLASLLDRDLGQAIGDEGLLLVAHRVASFDELARHVTARHHIVDINSWPELARLPASYEGLCW